MTANANSGWKSGKIKLVPSAGEWQRDRKLNSRARYFGAVGMLTNPFKLFGRFLIAGFQIAGYTVTFVIQVLWYLWYRRTHEIGHALGDFGRTVTNAIAGIFQQGT